MFAFKFDAFFSSLSAWDNYSALHGLVLSDQLLVIIIIYMMV